jgi:hypothetical protein
MVKKKREDEEDEDFIVKETPIKKKSTPKKSPKTIEKRFERFKSKPTIKDSERMNRAISERIYMIPDRLILEKMNL